MFPMLDLERIGGASCRSRGSLRPVPRGDPEKMLRHRFKKLLILAPLVLITDQLSKLLIVRLLPEGTTLPVIPGFFDIVSTRNPGAAFGAFASLPDSIRTPFFLATSAVAVVVILFYLARLGDEEPRAFTYLSLILGGALGNIADRLFRGEVVDFLSFHWQDRWSRIAVGPWSLRFKWEWPAFNVADAAITVGILFLTLVMIKSKKK